MILTKADILSKEDIVTEEVEVPEWGGSVLVKGLSGRQRDEFEGSMVEHRNRRAIMNTANMRAKLVVWSVVDEKGDRLFTNADVAELGEHSAAAVNRIYLVAAKLSGLSDEDVEGAVEDFGGTPGPSSSSRSRNGSGSRSASSSGTATPSS